MFHNIKTIFFTIGLFISAANPIMAQQGAPILVSYTVEAPETVKAGGTFTISVVFDIQPYWYVYAPIPLNMSQGKIPTRISFEPHNQFKAIGDLELPDESKGYDTYSGKDVIMSQKFKVPKDMAPGKQTINVTVIYQACSKKICYPPVEDKIAIAIKVNQPNG